MLNHGRLKAKGFFLNSVLCDELRTADVSSMIAALWIGHLMLVEEH